MVVGVLAVEDTSVEVFKRDDCEYTGINIFTTHVSFKLRWLFLLAITLRPPFFHLTLTVDIIIIRSLTVPKMC